MKKIPKSAKKYIRRQKSKIRKSDLSLQEQKEIISKLYKKYEDKRDILPSDKKGN